MQGPLPPGPLCVMAMTSVAGRTASFCGLLCVPADLFGSRAKTLQFARPILIIVQQCALVVTRTSGVRLGEEGHVSITRHIIIIVIIIIIIIICYFITGFFAKRSIGSYQLSFN